jgi:hypothetical protein
MKLISDFQPIPDEQGCSSVSNQDAEDQGEMSTRTSSSNKVVPEQDTGFL